MTQKYIELMADAFPKWLEKNTALDADSIKQISINVELFVNYLAIQSSHNQGSRY